MTAEEFNEAVWNLVQQSRDDETLTDEEMVAELSGILDAMKEETETE